MSNTRIQQLWNYLLQLNLFEKPSSTPQTTPKEHLATRIYLTSFIVSLLVAAFASILLVRTIERVESSPSVARFLHLSSVYPSTIQCLCSKLGIDYNTFVTVHAHSHQVCSSHFVQLTWIESIYLQPNRSASSLNDIQPMLSFFWQTIAGFCAVSEQTWKDTIASFTASYLLTPVAVDEHLLRSQVQAALDTQISLAQATLNRDLLAIRRSITGNQLVSALATNFYLHRPPTQADDSNVLKMTPRIFNNCSCLNNKGCPRSAIVIIDEMQDQPVSIPGMVVDCLVVDTTLASTLECYYQSDCFSRLHLSSSIDIPLLSSSTNKHFSVNDTVQVLLDGMMIDEVITDIDVDSFFSQCNPSSCSYSYSQRLNFLYSVTIIIGVFGGLSTLLRVTAVLIAEIVLQKRNRHSLNIGVNEPVAAEQQRGKFICEEQESEPCTKTCILSGLAHTYLIESSFLFQLLSCSIDVNLFYVIFDK